MVFIYDNQIKSNIICIETHNLAKEPKCFLQIKNQQPFFLESQMSREALWE